MENNTFRIGTLNCQNNKINRNGGIKDSGLDTAKILADHIQNKEYLCFNTQELTRVFSNRIQEYLSHYKLYGSPRYGDSNLVRKLKMIDDWNETNAIIANNKERILGNETVHLPFISRNPIGLVKSVLKGSIMPRIVTITYMNDKIIGDLAIMNTHLDYQTPNVQKNQLKNLLKFIKIIQEVIPQNIVLTGDFNMEIDNPLFDDFINKLDKLGLKRIEENRKTNADKFPNKSAIDHMFIPNKWIVEEYGLIEGDEISEITDHKGIYANVKIKK